MIDAVLLAALAAGLAMLGSVRLFVLILDRRDHAAAQHAEQAAIVAQARAELAATGWTPNQEALYQAEIAATKRGNLLAAAELAEEQERAA